MSQPREQRDLKRADYALTKLKFHEFSPFMKKVIFKPSTRQEKQAVLHDTRLLEVEPLQDMSDVYANGWSGEFGRLSVALRKRPQPAVSAASAP